MKNYLLNLVLFIIILFSAKCNIINPHEVTPTYVHIDSFSFHDPKLGSSSHNIGSVYAYFNNQTIGIFDLPVSFPVILDKPGILQLAPGVDNNGLKGEQIAYPFYQPDTVTLNVKPGETFNYNPKSNYYPLAISTWSNDFESNNAVSKFSFYNGNNEIILRNTANPFEGNASGKISLNDTESFATNVSLDTFHVNNYNQDSYLELNFKSSLNIQIGVLNIFNGNFNSQFLIGLKPKSEWTKIYINLRTFTSAFQGGTYNILVRVSKENGQLNGDAQFDNMRVVTFH